MNFIVKLNKNGLSWENEYAVSRWLDFVSKRQGKYVRISEIKSGRSLKSNSLYWVWLEAIGSYTGYSAEELHRLFKGLYLPKKTMKYRGKDYQMSGSTTELSTSEFQEYMEKIQYEAAQLGVVLPDPMAYKKFIDSAPMENEKTNH